MKLSKREIILLIIFAVVAAAAAYYFFWFAPNMERITELNGKIRQMERDIEDAKMRVTQFGLLSKTKLENKEQWDALVDSVPAAFDEADILKRIERYFAPYTTDITVEFPDETTMFTQTEIHPVTIRFSVTYDTLLSILTDFESDDTQLRIVNYESELMNIVEGRQLLNIVILAEFLTVVSGSY